MSKVRINSGKITVKDGWVTMNGAHVLIGENGEVKGGAGGALKGRKLSAKSTGGKSGGKSSAEQERAEANKKLKEELTRINTARQKYSNSIIEQTDEDDMVLEGFEREREKAYAEREAAEKRIKEKYGESKSGSSKAVTRFDKDKQTMSQFNKKPDADSRTNINAMMKHRRDEISGLQKELRGTKNEFRAKAIRQDLKRLEKEYKELDEM